MKHFLSNEWIELFQQQWNTEPELKEALSVMDFTGAIAYGYSDDKHPLGVVRVGSGEIVYAGAFEGQQLSWDIRATKEQWQKWLFKAPDLMGLGMADITGKLIFKVGDYVGMLKDPRLAGPFIKSFTVMGRVQ